MSWTVYIIHFSRAFHHARHYIGLTNLSASDRLAKHRAQGGARITAAAIRAGIEMSGLFVLSTHPTALEARCAEIKLKKRKESQRFCPLCAQNRCPTGVEHA